MGIAALITAILEFLKEVLGLYQEHKAEKPIEDLKFRRDELIRQNQDALAKGDLAALQSTRAELDKLERDHQ